MTDDLIDLVDAMRANPETTEALGQRYGVDTSDLFTAAGIREALGILRPMGENIEAYRLTGAHEYADKLAIQHEGRRLFEAVQAGEREPLTRVGLGALLDADLPPEQFIVDGLLHRGGNVLFTAARKSGKSTTIGNLIRSLVDGDNFLDVFEVVEHRRVALVDLELSTGTLQRWLREQGIVNQDAVDVYPLRGRARSFNIMNDAARSAIAEDLRGADVLILDPLRPLADALGLNEHTEMGRVLEALDALKAEAGISECIVVHHHGHNSDRARGDSRLEDWPDAIWRLNRDNIEDPRALRMFSAFGRDVDTAAGALRLDGKRLTFTGDVPAAKADRWAERIVEYLTEHGECKTAKLRDGIGLNVNGAADVLANAVASGLVVVRSEGPAKFYSLPTGEDNSPF